MYIYVHLNSWGADWCHHIGNAQSHTDIIISHQILWRMGNLKTRKSGTKTSSIRISYRLKYFLKTPEPVKRASLNMLKLTVFQLRFPLRSCKWRGAWKKALSDIWLTTRFSFQIALCLLLKQNRKPYGFIDGPFIPRETQSKKSEYIESAWECGCYLWILLSCFLNVFLFACSRLLLTRDTLCTGFWTQNNPPLITKNNILIVNTFFQSFMLKVMNVYSILITDK